ncbi:MAG: nuclear transport factor 2 family protein, partial [Bacteroidota bacterium]
LLSIIDGPEPNGQIYWSYNPNTKEVQHLSSFGEIRAGKGSGTVNEQGDVQLKLVFEGEPKGTYRIYNYRWLDGDTYHMKSVQFGENDKPTGLFYEGTFVRIKEKQEAQIKAEILENGATIRQAFLDGDIEKIKSLHHPDVVKALGYKDLKVGREAVINALEETLKYFTLEFLENDVESILIQGNMAIEQTKFSIKGTPKAGGDPFIFSGRTMVTYVRYAQSPTGWATIREIIQPMD